MAADGVTVLVGGIGSGLLFLTRRIHGTDTFTDPWMVDFYAFHVGI